MTRAKLSMAGYSVPLFPCLIQKKPVFGPSFGGQASFSASSTNYKLRPAFGGTVGGKFF